MLDLSTVDLGMLAMALEDHSAEGSWWIDAETGEVWYWRDVDDDDPEFDPDARDDARCIDPLPSHEGYGDALVDARVSNSDVFRCVHEAFSVGGHRRGS